MSWHEWARQHRIIWKKKLACKNILNRCAHLLPAGKYSPGQACDPKTWKANFRCAMNSLPDIEEVKDRSVNKGHQAMRVFRMLPSAPKGRGETPYSYCSATSAYYKRFYTHTVRTSSNSQRLSSPCTDKRSKARETKSRKKVNVIDVILDLFKSCHIHTCPD